MDSGTIDRMTSFTVISAFMNGLKCSFDYVLYSQALSLSICNGGRKHRNHARCLSAMAFSKRVPLDLLRPGVALSSAIADPQQPRVRLLGAGIVLTADFLHALNRRGVRLGHLGGL